MPKRKEREKDILKGAMQCLSALGCDPIRRNIRHDPVSGRDGLPKLDRKGRFIYANSEASGLPDITATVPGSGVRLEVEVKSAPNRPTKLQYAWIRRFNAQGAVAIWTDDLKWLTWAVQMVKQGARAGLDEAGESYLYMPEGSSNGHVSRAR